MGHTLSSSSSSSSYGKNKCLSVSSVGTERDPPLPPKLAAIHWIFFVSILEVHAQASLARLGFAYLGGFSISPSPRAEVRRGRTSLGRSVGYGSRNLHFFALKKGGAAAAAALNLLMKMATLVSLARVGVDGEGVAIAINAYSWKNLFTVFCPEEDMCAMPWAYPAPS